MPRPKHLTRGDVRFLAGTSRGDDAAPALHDVLELIDEIDAASLAADVDPALRSILDDLDDDGIVADPNALAEIRAELRGILGQVERGEYARPAGDPGGWAADLREYRERHPDPITTTGEETDDGNEFDE
jgi:hypothetical protein